MTSAFEDFKIYIDGASPDMRDMKTALFWYTCLMFKLRGHEIGDDLREVHVCPVYFSLLFF